MMDVDSYKAGQMLVPILAITAALWFLFKGIFAKTKSMRFANFALFCGLLVFCRPDVFFEAGEKSAMRTIFGLAGIVLGGIGIAFGAVALAARRKDEGTSVARPAIGLVLSVLFVASGASLVLMPSMLSAGPSDTAWKHQSSKYNVTITLPSAEWKYASQKDGTDGFFNRRLPMRANLFATPANREFYNERVKEIREMAMSASPGMKNEKGKLACGYEYDFIIGLEKIQGGSGEVYAAVCNMWDEKAGRIISVIFEADPKMISQAGRDTELRQFEESARKICLSAE